MDTYTVPTKYWHPLPDGKIQCDVCPRACQLSEGQRGMCFVRAREENQIVLTSYGRSSGFCIDPIEKKPLNHFLPGTSVLSFGTAGCNLSCKFCQNWDISKSKETESLSDSASPQVLVKAAKDLGCKSIAFTYNDPTVFLEYAIDVAKACRDEGIKSVAVTAGYICEEPRREFYDCIDAANVDLKAFTDDFYHKICGAHLEPVLDTLKYIRQDTNVWLEITTLLIPGKNDSEEELHAETKWIYDNLGSDVPLHFSAFHPDYKMLDIEGTPPRSLTRAREIALKNGLKYVYTGNIHDESGGSTYCGQCTKKIIGRDWYKITEYHLSKNGECTFCHAKVPGVFEEKVGTWGPRRLPVQLANYQL